MPKDYPTVSICMITYNHQDFILKAIEGVLNQETNFEFELIISNDSSNDSTHQIIQEVINNHPKARIISYTNQSSNIGMVANFNYVLNAAKGKYIALCEGDDYWTDNSKLQRQINFLDENEACSFSFHQAWREKKGIVNHDDVYPKFKKGLTILDEKSFFEVASVPTASVVYRNNITFPSLQHSHCDFMLYCTLLSKGRGGFINRAMSVYRMHDGGVTSQSDKNWYLERRIKELEIESHYIDYSKSVRVQIKKILVNNILFYLNYNRGKLSLTNKIKFTANMMAKKSFYKLSVASYLTLAKTLLK